MAVCAGCSRTLSGAYQQALGKTWHTQCFVCSGCRRPIGQSVFMVDEGWPYHSACFVCAHCRKPIGDERFVREGKHPYHRNCYKEQFGKRCHACQRVIDDQGIEALGHSFHAACFRCGRCRQPIADRRFLEKEGQPYHEACFHQAFTPNCAVCRQPLIKGGLQDSWGNRYCKEHVKQYPNCCSCSRLVCPSLTRGGKGYDDGRHICNLCYPSAVLRQDRALVLLSEMRRDMAQLGMPFERSAQLPFRLVDQAELKRFKKNKGSGHDVLGLTRANRLSDASGRVLSRELQEIIILYGLPEEHFRTVAVHELCHAWLFFNGFDDLPSLVEEGMCTLAEYLHLRRLESPEAKYRIALLEANPDPIYGKGFRAAQAAFERKGLTRLLAQVKEKRRFPGKGFWSWVLG